MRKFTVILVSSVGALGLLLGACSSTPPPDENAPNGIEDLAAYPAFATGADATRAATDLTARGTIGFENKAATITLRKGGSNVRATVKGAKSSYEVISVPGYIFVKADEKVWKPLLGDEKAASIQGRWVVSSSQGQLQSFLRFVDINNFFRASGRITKGPVTTINGQEALPIIDPPSKTDSTWWFATHGQPVLLRYKSGDFTRLNFTYDEVNAIAPPNADEVADIGSIQEGLLTAPPTTGSTP